jgi:hypothetical protein
LRRGDRARILPDEGLIYREEVVAILFALADVNVKLTRIVRLLEEDGEEEEEDLEDDA